MPCCWCLPVSRLTCVVARCAVLLVLACFSAGFCSGEPCRAVGACWGGWGPHTPCARQIGPHPPQPPPPSRHGPLRCVWVRGQEYRVQGSLAPRCVVCRLVPFPARPRIPVQAHTGSHGQGVSRSNNLHLQSAGDGSQDGSPLERAQREAAPPQAEICQNRLLSKNTAVPHTITATRSTSQRHRVADPWRGQPAASKLS